MRISDWRSDVCSSELSPSTVAMRSARYGGGQSTAMRCAKLSGTILLLALMMRPSRGLLMDGSSSKGTKPIQSNSPLQPGTGRSEEHTSELQSLMRISYAVFCLKKKTTKVQHYNTIS